MQVSKLRSAASWYTPSTRSLLLVTVVAGMLGAPGCDREQSDEYDARIAELDRLFAAVAEFEEFSGGVLVAEKGEVIYRRTFGSSHRESGTPMADDSRFELASVSKTFTAVLIHQLAEEGKLELEDSVSNFFPDLPYRTVTIEGMLNHTSGLFDVYGNPALRSAFYAYYGKPGVPYSSPDYLAYLERYKPPLPAGPGELDAYSNTAYVLLGLIVEKVTNRRFDEVLQTRIFDPAGMRDSLIISAQDDNKNLRVISGYLHDPVTGVRRDPDPDAEPGIYGITYGDDELASTLDDLLGYDRALRQGHLLPADRLEQMWQAARLADGTAARYGSGFQVEYKNGRRYVRHGGSTAGFWTNMKFSAHDNDNTVIVFTNMKTARTTISAIHEAIDNILLGLAYELPRQSVVFPLAAAIREDGASRAADVFERLSESGQYVVDRDHLQRLRGRYEFLGQAHAARAIGALM